MNLDPEQRSRLLRTKLAALVRDHSGVAAEPTEVGPIVAAAHDGDAFVLVDQARPGPLAAAVLWATRRHARRLVVFADTEAEVVARWAAYFGVGDGDADIEVRAIDAASSRSVVAAPLPQRTVWPDGAESLVEQLRDAGVEVVMEHGVVRGEVLGLEVARLVRWSSDVGGDDELHLEAGVGRFDRDAVAAVHPDEAPTEALARAMAAVVAHRHPGAAIHPLQLLVRERWLRATVVADPSLVGARRLEPVEMTTERAGLKDAHPAAALGETIDGDPLVVVCSAGVDLALTPLAADTAAMLDPSAAVVLALPASDHHAATLLLAGALRRPATVVAVPAGWS